MGFFFMKIVILGAGGMIGQKLARALVNRVIGKTKYTSLLMHDIIFPTNADKLGDIQIGNITSPGEVERVASERPDLIFHLASVVSGQAEKDFDIGWEVNLNPTLRVRGILLTMFDKRNKLSSQVDKEARNYFKEKVYQSVIPRNVRLSEAPSHGQPCVTYDKACSGSKAYFKLAEEFKNKIVSAA